VEGDERLRLFLALPLPGDALELLSRWQLDALGGAPDARIVPPGNLHVTLVFLGSRPAGEVEAIADAMREAAAGAERPVFSAVRYRETRSVGMLVLDDPGGAAARLQADLSERMERLGAYRPEGRAWLPHVTVLRFKRRPGLQPGIPAFSGVSPSEAALYTSELRRSGAQYEIRRSAPLGG
jgi:RNA 2',3'-cyclic 3'-phosphodiesterase